MSGPLYYDNSKIGTGTWVVVGAVGIGVLLLLTAAGKQVAGLIIVRAPGRQVQMPGGTTAGNLATLQAAFGSDVHAINQTGLYSVGVTHDTTANIPGARIL